MRKPPLSVTAITLLMESSRLFREDFRRRAQHLALTQAQTSAIACLARQPGLTQAELAERLEVRPVTVTQQLDRLQKAGWIRREAHENDRRAQRVYLTEQADPILADVWKIAEAARKDALRGLSSDEQTTLERLLAVVKANLLESASGARR